MTEGPLGGGASGGDRALVRHQQPGDEINQDLRTGEKEARNEENADQGGIEIESASDAGAHARDHSIVTRAVKRHVKLSFRDGKKSSGYFYCAASIAVAGQIAGSLRAYLRA
jgi:hypothetical protein